MTEAWYWWSGLLTSLFLIVMASAVYSTYRTNRGADKSKTLESFDGVDENDGPVPSLVFLGYFTFFIGAVVFLVLYPGIGNFSGVLGWSPEDDSVNAHRAPLESRVMGLVSGGADLTELMQQDDIVRAGASVFANHCAGCHGQDGRGQHNFPTLTDKDWLYGGDDRHLLATIRHGRNGHMPFWDDRLSADQVTALSGYIAAGLPQGDTSESVFVVNCASCHGVRGQGNYAVGGPNLVDDVWLHGDQMDDLEAIIYAGARNEMPAFDGQLSNGQIYAVASYVASLSRTEAGAYPDVDDFLAGTASLTMTTAVCAGCHGVDGAGIEGVAPELAALSVKYLNTQLLRFRRGERNNRAMQTVLEDMNRADITVAPEYFSGLPPVTPDVVIREVDAVVAAGEFEDGTVVVETESIVESVSTIPARRGDVVVYDDPFAELANQGDWDRGIPACVTCHLTAAVGSGPFPRLRGQDASYLARQLSAWQQGERSGDPDNMMGSIAKKLTDEEIRGLADYFSKL